MEDGAGRAAGVVGPEGASRNDGDGLEQAGVLGGVDASEAGGSRELA